jgi:hypothetical protein
VRWFERLHGTGPTRIAPAELFTSYLDGDRIELSTDFTEAFERELVSDLTTLGAELRNANSYAGIGSLPQTDLVACRNNPVLRLADGSLVPMSLELVADRAAVLWRFRLSPSLGGARSGIAALGHQFEAYITDVLTQRTGSHHRVLSEADITSVLGGATRCDQVVVCGDDWLFVENSMITLSRQVVAGGLSAIDEVCDRYHAEADQAAATALEADRLAAAFGLPAPRTRSILVVTDNPIMHSPSLMQRLWLQRPDRNPRFVCSVRELEHLAELVSVGWSMPGTVQKWQHQAVEGPLQSAIHDVSNLASAPARMPTSTEDWIAMVPRKKASAA